jgi:hypothetical protein
MRNVKLNVLLLLVAVKSGVVAEGAASGVDEEKLTEPEVTDMFEALTRVMLETRPLTLACVTNTRKVLLLQLPPAPPVLQDTVTVCEAMFAGDAPEVLILTAVPDGKVTAPVAAATRTSALLEISTTFPSGMLALLIPGLSTVIVSADAAPGTNAARAAISRHRSFIADLRLSPRTLVPPPLATARTPASP